MRSQTKLEQQEPLLASAKDVFTILRKHLTEAECDLLESFYNKSGMTTSLSGNISGLKPGLVKLKPSFALPQDYEDSLKWVGSVPSSALNHQNRVPPVQKLGPSPIDETRQRVVERQPRSQNLVHPLPRRKRQDSPMPGSDFLIETSSNLGHPSPRNKRPDSSKPKRENQVSPKPDPNHPNQLDNSFDSTLLAHHSLKRKRSDFSRPEQSWWRPAQNGHGGIKSDRPTQEGPLPNRTSIRIRQRVTPHQKTNFK
jgi:hypothetical protein